MSIAIEKICNKQPQANKATRIHINTNGGGAIIIFNNTESSFLYMNYNDFRVSADILLPAGLYIGLWYEASGTDDVII